MKSLIVEQAANGFIVRDTPVHRDMCVAAVPHVFESFESLTAHLKQELTPPEAGVAGRPSGARHV